MVPPGPAKLPEAYFIDNDMPVSPGHPQTFRRESYDCWGRIFGNRSTWWTWMGGGKWVRTHEFGLLGMGKVVDAGVMKDVRTIKMIQGGCCPPGLTIALLSGDSAGEEVAL